MKNCVTATCEFCHEFNESMFANKAETVLDTLFSDSRIISANEKWNLIPTLGCFKIGYTLLVNHEHFPSLYHCPIKDKILFLYYIDVLKTVYKEVFDCEFFMFEHGIVDETVQSPNSVNHVHLHFLPCSNVLYDITHVLKVTYHLEAIAFSSVFELDKIIDERKIRTYLLYYVSEKYYLIDIGNKCLPSQFLRKVIYNLEGFTDDGWNWKTKPFFSEMLSTYTIMKKKFDEITSASFSRRAFEYEKEASWITADSFIYKLIPFPFGNKRFLEVASGTGIVSDKAQKAGWKATALDLCVDMLEKVNPTISKVLANAEKIPFENESFDLVVCRQGLQYMNMYQALFEMIRVSSTKIVLLHASVDERDVLFWKHIFSILGYVGKRILGNDEIKSILIEHFGDQVSIVEEVMYSNEEIKIPSGLLDEIDKVMLNDDGAIIRNKIIIDGNSMFYSLEWRLLVLNKVIR